MYLVFEKVSGQVKKLKEITPQEIQALIDTEDYTIVQVEPIFTEAVSGNQIPRIGLHMSVIEEDLVQAAIADGQIKQDSSIVQVV